MTPSPNLEQATAIATIVAWANDPAGKTFHVLQAPAGCGKTFCVRHLIDKIRGRMVFVAPTNKATKVLRTALTSPDYKPDCRTIYSLLGLALSADGEVKELKAPEEPIDLSAYRLIVCDEGSMLNSVVMQHLQKTAKDYKLKVLVLGDQYQLPPVKEPISPIWKIPNVSTLTKVMRHDNQILACATALRGNIDNTFSKIELADANSGGQGVFRADKDFPRQILLAATAGEFSRPDSSKLIAWRNITVDHYNQMIRAAIFPTWRECPWFPEDRVLFAAPAKDLEDKTIATTDDEGTVAKVVEAYHPIYGEFKIYEVSITLDDNRLALARVLHPMSQQSFDRKSADLAEAARLDRRLWRKFWDFKEAFHQLRHGYAITAHRSQGSTYDTAFVNYKDILLNRDRGEALRCLYVACSRPKRRLILGG